MIQFTDKMNCKDAVFLTLRNGFPHTDKPNSILTVILETESPLTV